MVGAALVHIVGALVCRRDVGCAGGAENELVLALDATVGTVDLRSSDGCMVGDTDGGDDGAAVGTTYGA